MPKGSKTCQKCKALNGPRAFYCKSCNEPFVLKGKVVSAEEIARVKIAKNVIIKAKSEDDDFDDEETLEGGFLYDIYDYFRSVDYTKDKSNTKYYDGAALCWESKDGKYRLRHARTFLGININLLHGKPYMVEKISKNNDNREVWSLIGRFRTPHSAIVAYLKDLNNVVEKPVDVEQVKKKKMRRILKNVNRSS